MSVVGIPCPGCGVYNTKVVNSRANNNCVYRRRQCLDCGTKFSTAEELVAESTRGGPGGGVVTRAEEMAAAIETLATACAALLELTGRTRK